MTHSTKSASSSFSEKFFFFRFGIICLIFRRLSLKFSINCIFRGSFGKYFKDFYWLFRKFNLFIVYLCSVSFRKSIKDLFVRHLKGTTFLKPSTTLLNLSMRSIEDDKCVFRCWILGQNFWLTENNSYIFWNTIYLQLF